MTPFPVPHQTPSFISATRCVHAIFQGQRPRETRVKGATGFHVFPGNRGYSKALLLFVSGLFWMGTIGPLLGQTASPTESALGSNVSGDALSLAFSEAVGDVEQPGVASTCAATTVYSLEACLEMALENNLEIRAQKKALISAFHKVREQLSLAKPKIGFQDVYTVQGKVPGFGESKLGDKELNIAQVTLKQPVYSFGRLESGVQMVREQYKAEEAVFEKTRTDIIHEVVRSFVNVLKAGNRVSIAEETIQVLREHLKLVETLFQAGVVLNTDVSTTKVKVLEARQRLIEERNSYDIAKITLCNLLRLPEDFQGRFEDIPPMPLNASTSFQNSEQQPEMKKLGHLIQAGENWYFVEKRGNLPIVGFQWAYSTGNQFMEKFQNWNANLVLDLPIFDSGSTRAKKAQAKANLEMMKLTRDSVRQRFSLAIQQSARKVREMQEKFVLARQIVEAAQENFTNLQNQFKEGAIFNTDVLSGNLTTTNAKLGVTNAYYEYVAYLADHFQSQGDMTGFLSLINSARQAATSLKEK